MTLLTTRWYNNLYFPITPNNNNHNPITPLLLFTVLLLTSFCLSNSAISVAFQDFALTNPGPDGKTLGLRLLVPYPCPPEEFYKLSWKFEVTWDYKHSIPPEVAQAHLLTLPDASHDQVASFAFQPRDRAVVQSTGRLDIPPAESYDFLFFHPKLNIPIQSFGPFDTFRAGDLIGTLSIELTGSVDNGRDEDTDQEQPSFSISINNLQSFVTETPNYTPPIYEQHLSIPVNLQLNMIKLKGNELNIVSPYFDHFVRGYKNFTLFRWSIDIPWNTHIGGQNEKTDKINTTIGQVRPKYLQIRPHADLFLTHNSTTPFSPDPFICFINGIEASGIMTSRKHQFKTQFDEGKTDLESNETFLEITLTDSIWNQLLPSNFYRFGSFSIHCGPNVLLASLMLTNQVFSPPGLIVGFSDLPVPTLSYHTIAGSIRGTATRPDYLSTFLSMAPKDFAPYTLFGVNSVDCSMSDGTDDDDNNTLFEFDNVDGGSMLDDDNNNNNNHDINTSTALSPPLPSSTPKFVTAIPPPVIAPIHIYEKTDDLSLELVVMISVVFDFEHFANNHPCIIQQPTVAEAAAAGQPTTNTPTEDEKTTTTILPDETGPADETSDPIYCPLALSIGLPKDNFLYFQALLVDDVIDIYYESLDGEELFTTTTTWLTPTRTEKFNLPIKLINTFKHHTYFKMNIPLRVRSSHPLRILNTWVQNEIFINFFSDIFQSSIFIPYQIPVEHWFLDSKDSIGSHPHIPNYENGNTILDLKYKKIGYDLITLSTTSPSLQLINMNTPDAQHHYSDLVPTEITIHLIGEYEFDLSQIHSTSATLTSTSSTTKNTSQIHSTSGALTHSSSTSETQNKNQIYPTLSSGTVAIPSSTSSNPPFSASKSSPILIHCDGQLCQVTDFILSSRAISFKIMMIKNEKKKDQNFLKSMKISFDKKIKFKKSKYEKIDNIFPPDLLEMKESPFESIESIESMTDINDSDHIIPTTSIINLIAHIVMRNTSSSYSHDPSSLDSPNLSADDVETINLALSFQYNSDLKSVSSALMAKHPPSGLPMWFFIFIGGLGIVGLILIAVGIKLCFSLVKDEVSADLQETMLEEFDGKVSQMKNKINTIVGKVLDEYQPPKYTEFENDSNPEGLPEYDPEIEQSNIDSINGSINGSGGNVDVKVFVNETDNPSKKTQQQQHDRDTQELLSYDSLDFSIPSTMVESSSDGRKFDENQNPSMAHSDPNIVTTTTTTTTTTTAQQRDNHRAAVTVTVTDNDEVQ